MKKIKLSAISLFVIAATQAAWADTANQPTSLETISVTGDSSQNILEKKVGETQKTAKELSKQQVQDSRDLVRYETGITVVENGRFGSSGYAVRGVDENRVAIVIDGLHQAETLSSQGFKELFEGYGNFNNTRNNTEIETLKKVAIRKGADSVKVGSGALGGAVVFETKDARDFLTNKNWFISYKRGYSSADNQHLNTLTLAGKYKWFDVLIVNTTRRGHELENYGYKNYDEHIQGSKREKADPYRKKQDSILAKFAFQPNENHRFSVMADIYKNTSQGHDFSYNLKPNTHFRTYDEIELRHTNDKVERKNYSFSYENYSSNIFYDTLKITYSNQRINARARTDDYCHGNEKCPDQTNPLGMKYNSENKLVGEDGKLAEYIDKPASKTPDASTMINVDVEPYNGSNGKYRWQRAKWDSIPADYTLEYKGCDEEFSSWNPNNQPKLGDSTPCLASVIKKGSEIPAEKRLSINGKDYDLLGEDKSLITDNQIIRTNTPFVLSCDGINCDKKTISAFNHKDGTTVELPFEVIERDGKKLAVIEGQGGSQLDSPQVLVPNKSGYISNEWSQRDLITKTKQINLDLTKYFELGNTQHNFSYGGLWSEVEKKMVNISGSSSKNIKWWAVYPLNCEQVAGNVERYNSLCNNSNVFSFLIPVKATTHAIYFDDDFKVNDYLSFNIGYRYDRVKYKPEYKPGVTPRIPSDMVTNLYETEPKFNPSKFDDLNNEALRTENANANIKHISQPKKYSASSYSLTATVDPLAWLRLQAKYSKGFRAPSGEEIYFTFKHPDFSILPNKDLRQEIAKTKEVALTLHNNYGFITTSLFHTKYENFIDLAFIGNKELQGHSKLIPFSVYQNINRQNARVVGIDISSKLNLDALTPILNGFNMGYKFTYQKGKINGNIPMNAIQPKTSIFSLGYEHNSGKFGVDLYLTHVSAKKAKDTYNMFWETQRADELAAGKEITIHDSSVKWRNNAYTLIDMIMYAKPIENLTLQFGVYNLTNRKYLTWDSVRSIRPFGTSNLINQKTGEGINRFNAPGRNFKLNAEFTF